MKSLFYVLEYIPEPVKYLSRLINLLQKPGKIVIVTPNLKDPLKDIWKNKAFGEFFYDKHAVNYFSSKSLESLFQHLISYNNNLKHSTRSLQGYSIINHIGWFLNNKPSTTGKVGGDYFMDDLNKIFYEKNDICSTLKEMIISFDRNYKDILQSNNTTNYLICELYLCK